MEDARQASGHGARGGTLPGLARRLVILWIPARERHGGIVPEHQEVVEAERAVVGRTEESRNLQGAKRLTVGHLPRVGAHEIGRMQP